MELSSSNVRTQRIVDAKVCFELISLLRSANEKGERETEDKEIVEWIERSVVVANGKQWSQLPHNWMLDTKILILMLMRRKHEHAWNQKWKYFICFLLSNASKLSEMHENHGKTKTEAKAEK